jgi:CO/xanthine dehydrogenase Mo-binding subunit
LVHTGEPLAGHFADLSTLKPQRGTNICHRFSYARGNAAAALDDAHIVLDDTFDFPRVQHYAMEPNAAVAAWDETGALTVWAGTQNPYSVRVELAKMFGVPLARIRIVVPHLGGGFGSKTYAKLEPLAAVLARAAGRPVRLAASAAEAFQTVRRCGARVRMRVGLGRDGALLAVECHADYDVGAYADIGPRVVQKGTYTATGPYRVPHIALAAHAVYTNTTPGGAFRGFGVPQLAWGLESLLDVAAERLDRDPVDLRRQNLLAHGEEFAPGDTPIDGKFEESLSRAVEAVTLTEGAADRGRGVAAMLKASIAPSVSEAIVRLHADGSVTVLASTVEMGQGARTALAQIAAEVLAVPLNHVTVAPPDTAITPYDQTTSSSRSTTMTGRAVQEAAADVRDQLLRIVADHFQVVGRELTVEESSVVSGGRRLSYPEVLALRFGMTGGELIGRGIVAPGRTQAPLGGSTPFWEMAVGAAEVSVDEETGAVTVERYVSVADVGRAVNPLILEGQDEGAVVQGLGHTLFEEMAYADGHLLNGNLLTYRVPRAEDVPAALECRFTENADGSGPFGAKGAGEGSLIPVSPAVANALARLTGIRLRELPLLPERVWRALRARGRR